MKYLYLILTLFLISCSSTGTISDKIDIRAVPHVKSYINEAYARDISLDITGLVIKVRKFKGEELNDAGRCKVMPFRRIIELNEEFMDYASYDEIEILIYHELTHCLFLYMKHKDDIYHVMNTYLMPSYGPLGREFHLNMMFEEAKNHNFWFSLFNF